MSRPGRKRHHRNSKFRPVDRCNRCHKISYRSENAANRAIRTRGGLRAYPCPHKRGIWHVTTRPYRVREKFFDEEETQENPDKDDSSQEQEQDEGGVDS